MTSNLNSSRRLFLIAVSVLSLFGIASVPFLKQQLSASSAVEDKSNQTQISGPDSQRTRNATSKFVISNAPADKLLQQKIDVALQGAVGRWGIFVMSLQDGRVLYARDADRSFIPASNMKLFTTAAALDLLGPDHRWRTSVLASSRPDKAGVINGDLTLYGRGAPDLIASGNGEEASLKQLASKLHAEGLRRVKGNVVGDESYFRGEPLGDGWLWNDVQWYFGAEVSALSINGNEIALSIAPGAKLDDPAVVKVVPDTNFVQLKNETLTAEQGAVESIGINRGLSDNTFRVWGDFPLKSKGLSVRLAVHQPALWAAKLFRDELIARGIMVDGDVILRDARSTRDKDRFDSQQQVELAFVSSTTLGDLTRSINKESLNLEAELVLRTLGKLKGGDLLNTDPSSNPYRGDDEAGLAAISYWLEAAGISTQNISLHDGSGLSRLNLVTPEATARLLAAMSTKSFGTIFRNSLPIAGRDGTLRNRLRTSSSLIYAKTGTLTYSNSLSGYIVTNDKERLVFSIISNDEVSHTSSTNVIDHIVNLLASL
jgi:D-alanyl-D-alanine carboxypeptidase/D-alanyl-D-alanine-endopeptidase (penicillin-binding protein 4)